MPVATVFNLQFPPKAHVLKRGPPLNVDQRLLRQAPAGGLSVIRSVHLKAVRLCSLVLSLVSTVS